MGGTGLSVHRDGFRWLEQRVRWEVRCGVGTGLGVILPSQPRPQHVEHGATVLGLTRLLLLPRVGDPDPVLRCIVSGFFANAARFHSTGAYR